MVIILDLFIGGQQTREVVRGRERRAIASKQAAGRAESGEKSITGEG